MKRSETRNVLLEYSPSGRQFHYNINGRNFPSAYYHALGWCTFDEANAFCEVVQPFITQTSPDDKEVPLETVRESWRRYCEIPSVVNGQGKSAVPIEDESVDGIDESTILVTDDGEYYFLCAGPTFKRMELFEHPDCGQTESLPADYVKARVCYVVSMKKAVLNEYYFPLTGPMSIKYHRATEEERNFFISRVLYKDMRYK